MGSKKESKIPFWFDFLAKKSLYFSIELTRKNYQNLLTQKIREIPISGQKIEEIYYFIKLIRTTS